MELANVIAANGIRAHDGLRAAFVTGCNLVFVE